MGTNVAKIQEVAKNSSEILTSESNEMGLLNIFEYNGNSVSFKRNGSITYVNATEMGRIFNKQSSDFTKTSYCHDFMRALSGTKNIRSADLLIVIRGGNLKQGSA